MADWDDGTYELTAQALAPAADVAVAAAGIRAGEAVLDVGCGTGNAALVAARCGARVTGVDPAPGLLRIARERVPDGEFLVGDGAALPLPDDRFDATVSVFGVIFVPDADAAVAELVRVTAPGGRIVVTSWLPEGPIAGAGRLVRQALTGRAPAGPADERPAATPASWGDEAFAHAVFAPHPVTVGVTEETIAFTAASPEAWFAEQEESHPVWRAARTRLDDAAAWADLRERTVAVLRAGNEDPQAFRVRSRYLVIHALLD